MKRVVFIGSSQWGLRALAALCDLSEMEVVGAITNPPVFQVSYRPEGVRNVNYADVAGYCEGHDIAVYAMGPDEPMKSAALAQRITTWRPDFFFVLGWYHIIPRSIRAVAPVLGIHYSLLPDYAGGAPLVWALINGESEVGATLFQLDGGVDTGPILGQVRVSVGPRETIATLYRRVGEASLEMMREALAAWTRGEAAPEAQPTDGRRRCAQRGPEDGVIDWRRPAAAVDRWVRAQTRPYPGAFTTLAGERVHIWEATPAGPVEGAPGVAAEGGVVPCGDGEGLRLMEVETARGVFVGDDVPAVVSAGVILGPIAP